MIETKRFKKSFFLGRLIWVKGREAIENQEIVFDILKSCQVLRTEVLVLRPAQFISMMSRGLSQITILNYEVFLIQGFDSLSPETAKRFLRCLEVFKSLQMGIGIRVVLASGISVARELSDFESFNPVVIQVNKTSYDPGDLNERIHYLVAKAMKITDTPVKRISEQAAAFLEYHFSDETDQDVLELLVIGLNRSDGQVLRFKDFLPGYRFDSDFDSDSEAHAG